MLGWLALAHKGRKGPAICFQQVCQAEIDLCLFVHKVFLDPMEVITGGNEDDPLPFLVELNPQLIHRGVEKPSQTLFSVQQP